MTGRKNKKKDVCRLTHFTLNIKLSFGRAHILIEGKFTQSLSQTIEKKKR